MSTQGKNGKKAGRNKKSCERYMMEGKREKNKAMRLFRFLITHPANKDCRNAWDKLPLLARRGTIARLKKMSGGTMKIVSYDMGLALDADTA